MNMGIGFSEIVVIVLLILIFFGSKELPRFIREGARLLAQARRYGDKVREELDEVTKNLDGPPPVPHDTMVAREKQELRKKYLTLRKAMNPGDRAEKSKSICATLMSAVQYQRAGAIMVYANMGAEVETGALIAAALEAGKRVVLPYCRSETRSLGIGEIKDPAHDIVLGAKKVPEPREDLRDIFFRSDLQLIVCPGVGFDLFGGRLGRGFAYYDNFLREFKGRVPIVGLAFDDQVQTGQFPFSYSDVVMDQIVTESGFKLPQTIVGVAPNPATGGTPTPELAG
jgi:5-formyltetrahydrofolate cyclo-ligase